MKGTILDWREEDSIAASKQGWCLFESVGDVVEVQIQREDELEIFTTDEEAVAFVKTQAAKGDELAKKAISTLIMEKSSDVARFKLAIGCDLIG